MQKRDLGKLKTNNMGSYFRQGLENWLKTIDVKAHSVLDIGGSQNPIKGRTKSWEVNDFKILDLPNPHEDKPQPDIVCDLNLAYLEEGRKELEAGGDKTEGCDVAFCLEVMEYLYNPYQAVKNMACLLKSRGVLYISFPFLYPIHPPTGTDYLRYTKYGACRLLEEAGFTIEKVVPRVPENKGRILDFWVNDKYRFDKTESYDSLVETGCLIKAIKN